MLLVFFSALISLQALFVHRVVDVVEEGSPVVAGTAAHTTEEEGIADTMGEEGIADPMVDIMVAG